MSDETVDMVAKSNSQPPDSLAQPTIIGDYLVVDELARGGMGVVYRARHRKLGREVAMKVILSGQFASPIDVRRFEMEASSVASLDHPGIIPIYETGQHEGHHFFTMKLVEGGSLAKHITEIRRDLRRFVEIVAQIAEAIDYAHRRGILHRDIKPANILLDVNGHPVVTDLGLAKRTETDSDLTGTGGIVGTPSYMPPEQASASTETTTAADIYSIGAILYEGLTGQPPHKGDSPLATLMLAASAQPKPPSDLNRGCDRVLELVCMKCLSREPSDRYPSASMLANDLRCWLDGKAVSVRPKSFASLFSELIADQMSSALGAVIIGVVGGFLTGLPVYSNLAVGLFGDERAPFNMAKLTASMPQLSVLDAWWLHPPPWMSTLGFLISILLSISLGIIIQRVVRPKEVRQAVAIGLVTGLLMTIVQFTLYGIAINWQTFHLANAQKIEWLAHASLAPEQHRGWAVDRLNAAFPDLANAQPSERATLLGKAVSASIMLSTPANLLGVMLVCLSFSTIYCVFGTVHFHRLQSERLGRLSTITLYSEVMLIMTLAMAIIVLVIFFTFGMVINDSGVLPLPTKLIPMLIVCLAATIPGWKKSPWYFRLPTYVICAVVGMLLLWLG